MSTDPTPETARALLYRHGLPEDVIDGALCLHAQELAAVQRNAHDELRPFSHMGLPCKPDYDCGVRMVIDLIDPTRTVPAAGCVVSAAPTQTDDRDAVRDRIADVLAEADGWQWVTGRDKARSSTYRSYQSRAAAVLAVLPPPADRAAVLLEAAEDLATAFGDPKVKHIGAIAASHLRRRARELEGGEAGDEQPETPLEKRFRYSERRNDELRAECKRRGKINLEYAEKIERLEKQLDEVCTQLGAEILRAGQAEATLERIQRVIRRLANHAVGFQDVLDDSDRDPWAKTVGADIAELRRVADEAQQPSPRCTCGETVCESELCDCDSAPCPADHAVEAQPQPDTETPTAPTDEDILVAVEEALEGVLLPDPGFGILEATRGAVLAALAPLVSQLRLDRDLAIAHDRQPYPTAWSYEQACKALRRKTEAIERVREKATEWTKLAPADDWGDTPQDTALADTGRYLLRLIDSTDTPAVSGPRAADNEPPLHGESVAHIAGCHDQTRQDGAQT